MAMIPDNFCIEVARKREGFTEHYCTVELPLTRTKNEAAAVFEELCERFGPEFELELVRVSCRPRTMLKRNAS